jgi:2-oxoglutarate ferredoxin oxidoreductase subunit alpha
VRYLNPFPSNLGDLLKNYKQVLIPEMNNGQLNHLIRSKYLVDAKGLHKIKGVPFTANEIVTAVKSTISNAK